MREKVIAAAAVVALGCALVSGCDAASAPPVPSAKPTPTSENALKAQQQALVALRAWLTAPTSGSMTVSSVEFNQDTADPAAGTEEARELTGVFDPYAQTASLSGTSTTLSDGSTDQSQFEAAQSGGWLYTTIGPNQTAAAQGRQWLATDLSNGIAGTAPPSPSSTATGTGSADAKGPSGRASAPAKPASLPTPSATPDATQGSMSPGSTLSPGSSTSPDTTPSPILPPTQTLWWKAFQALDSVTIDGPSEVNTKSAIEFTGTVDLASIPGVPQALLHSPVVQEAGTTVASIDLYTDLVTKALVRVTYRIGLDVSVDATVTPTSSAGYEVDLSSFGQAPTPTPSPTVTVPDPGDVATGGDDDLCYLLPF